MKKIKRYSELRRLGTLKERFDYLKLGGVVGRETFGSNRYLNQMVYRDPRWKPARDAVILRDGGCDLGIEGYEVYSKLTIHHINPITEEDILANRPEIFDPEFLICTSQLTHTAIHYGDETLLPQPLVVRRKNDTCPWKF